VKEEKKHKMEIEVSKSYSSHNLKVWIKAKAKRMIRKQNKYQSNKE